MTTDQLFETMNPDIKSMNEIINQSNELVIDTDKKLELMKQILDEGLEGIKPEINNLNSQINDIRDRKIDDITLLGNSLTLLANNNAIKTINLPTSTGTGGSSDILVTTNISGTTLSLTTDKYQTTTVVDGTEITLPTVTSFTEIHLFFETATDLTLILPSCKWQNGNTPTISANKTYEFIFTYTTEWLGGVITYE